MEVLRIEISDSFCSFDYYLISSKKTAIHSVSVSINVDREIITFFSSIVRVIVLILISTIILDHSLFEFRFVFHIRSYFDLLPLPRTHCRSWTDPWTLMYSTFLPLQDRQSPVHVYLSTLDAYRLSLFWVRSFYQSRLSPGSGARTLHLPRLLRCGSFLSTSSRQGSLGTVRSSRLRSPPSVSTVSPHFLLVKVRGFWTGGAGQKVDFSVGKVGLGTVFRRLSLLAGHTTGQR